MLKSLILTPLWVIYGLVNFLIHTIPPEYSGIQQGANNIISFYNANLFAGLLQLFVFMAAGISLVFKWKYRILYILAAAVTMMVQYMIVFANPENTRHTFMISFYFSFWALFLITFVVLFFENRKKKAQI